MRLELGRPEPSATATDSEYAHLEPPQSKKQHDAYAGYVDAARENQCQIVSDSDNYDHAEAQDGNDSICENLDRTEIGENAICNATSCNKDVHLRAKRTPDSYVTPTASLLTSQLHKETNMTAIKMI